MAKAFYFSLLLYAISLPLSISGTSAALALLSVLAAVQLKQTRNLPIPGSFLCLLIFLLWAGATRWIANGDFKSLSSFSKIWNFLPYVLLPLFVSIESLALKKALKVVVGIACAVVVLGALEYRFGFHYFFEDWPSSQPLIQENRFHGFQSHPMHSGALYAFLSLAALSAALFDGKSLRQNSGWIAGSILLALGVFLTSSRSYYLGLFFGAFFLLFRRGWKFFLAGAAVATVLVFALAGIDSRVRARLQTLDARQTDQSAKLRVYMWQSALLMIKDHPWTGVGYRRWKEEVMNYARYLPDWRLDRAAFAHAHNSFLTVGAETGLLGLSLFLLFWISLLKEQWSALSILPPIGLARALTESTLAMILAGFVAAFFEHNLLTAVFALALSFFVGLSRLAAELKSAEAEPAAP